MNRSVWAIVIGIILVLLIVVACAFVVPSLIGGYGPYGFGMMRPGMMSGYRFPVWGGIGVLLFGAFFVAGVVLLVVWIARGTGNSSVSAPRSDSVLDILKMRYAKGEITKEQFEEMKHDLNL